MGKLLYTPEEVRSLVFDNKISKSTLINYLRDGKIQGLRVGRKWFVTQAAVNSLVNRARGSTDTSGGDIS